MKKVLVGFIAFLMIFLDTANAFALPPKLIKEFKKTVVFVAVESKGEGAILASGFPIDKSSFLTAGHFCDAVAKGQEEGDLRKDILIQYLNQNEEVAVMSGASIVRYKFDESTDICLISRVKHGIPPVRLSVRNVHFGDKLYVVGAPKGFFPTITEGYVSQAESTGMPIDILNGKLMMSAPMTQGNSGGPVFNSRGEVVGIGVMVHPPYLFVCWAVPIGKIWDFLLNGE